MSEQNSQNAARLYVLTTDTPLGGQSLSGYRDGESVTPEYADIGTLTRAYPEFLNAPKYTPEQLIRHPFYSVPVQFPQQDTPQKRIMLLLSETEDSYLFVNLTSEKQQKNRGKYTANIHIRKSAENGLRYSSYLKCDTLYEAPKNLPGIHPLRSISLGNTEYLAASHLAKELEELGQLRRIALHTNFSDEFRQLTDQVQDLTDHFKSDPELLSEFIEFRSRFYAYSSRNQYLIFLQNRYSTFTASYTGWQKLGYSVKQGAHALRILRPVESVSFERNGAWVSIRQADNEEKARIAEKKLPTKRETSFVRHNVFDISQTTCPPTEYPLLYSMGYSSVAHQVLYDNLKEFIEESGGYAVTLKELESISLSGYCSFQQKEIVINSLLADTGRLDTLLHEFSHALLHETSTQPKAVVEFEAESMAMMLQCRLGLELSEQSKRYICGHYQKIDQHSFDLDASFSRMEKAFRFLSEGLHEKLAANGVTLQLESALPRNQSSAPLPQSSENAILQNFLGDL